MASVAEQLRPDFAERHVVVHAVLGVLALLHRLRPLVAPMPPHDGREANLDRDDPIVDAALGVVALATALRARRHALRAHTTAWPEWSTDHVTPRVPDGAPREWLA
jgi:hypothetical protein